MRVFEYDYANFKDVSALLAETETANRPGEKGKMLFNTKKSRFEYYAANEINTIDPHQTYGSVRLAIEKYIKVADNNDPNAVNTLDTVIDQDYSRWEELDKEVPPIMIDDPDESLEVEGEDTTEEEPIPFDEVFENSQSILKVIQGIQKTVNEENREKILKVIGEIYKLDVVSESDVLKTIVENTELKKLLSLVFETFGVEVTKTVGSYELKVSTATIKFNHKIENTLEDYKRGIAQALANINALKASRDEITNLENKLAEAGKALAQERKNSTELGRQISVLADKKDPVRELKNIAPLIFVVCWKTEKGTIDYLRVRKDKVGSKTEDGSFPTKYLERTSHLSKAQKFTSAEAHAQIAKIIRFKSNVTFTALPVSPRELSTYFIVARVSVERIEAVTSTNE